jgi:membrane-bound lytic murein transglycosylase B
MLKKRGLQMNYLKIIPLLSLLILSSGCLERQKKLKEPVVVAPGGTNHGNLGTGEVIIVDEPHHTVNHGGISQQVTPPIPVNAEARFFNMNMLNSPYLQGAYANNYKLKSFINEMVNKYGFRREYLYGVFSSVNRDVEALKKIGAFGNSAKLQAKATAPGSWDKYRAQFITKSRIEKGVAFWNRNQYYLNKAAKLYGVAPEYIIGIIGVETNFGGFTGKHNLLNALTSIALEFPKRSKFFKSELENYLLMTREQRMDPRHIEGSYAGAFGLSQFMPSSFREYAVDHDANGQINLFTEADAIGSVANYFKEKGKWNPTIPVAVLTTYPKNRFYGLKTGFRTSYSQRHLLSLGMRPINNFYGYRGDVSLIKLSRYTRDELWWGTPNFYSIARYNPKDHYAMAVHQLAQAVRRAYWQQAR